MIKGIEHREVKAELEVRYPVYYPGGRRYAKGTLVKVKTGDGWVVMPIPELDSDGNVVE